jgi:hypothetical protein
VEARRIRWWGYNSFEGSAMHSSRGAKLASDVGVR